MNMATKSTNKKGLAVPSLVLGIISVLTSLVWFISITLGVAAIVLGAMSLKSPGRGIAIAGIVTGVVGTLISIVVPLVAFMALPVLQEGQRDVVRKTDLSVITTDIAQYQTDNAGKLPAASDLSTTGLTLITSVTDSGAPTTDTAKYEVGKTCDGQVASRTYSLSIALEGGPIYCLDM
jgi:hypothetical protein